MELSKQVVSLELAQKLKELLVKQESLFYWQEMLDGSYEAKFMMGNLLPLDGTEGNCISAFTVAELGEMLSGIYMPFKDENGRKPWLWIEPDTGNKTWEETEADARAKMLIYLVESKVIVL
jgi:hypothetical protein